MGMLGLYTKFTAHPGQGNRLVEQLSIAADLISAKSAGCQLYIVNMSPSDAETVWVTEVWNSEDDHRAALSTEGAPALIAQTMPLLAGPPDQIRVIPVAGKGLTL